MTTEVSPSSADGQRANWSEAPDGSAILSWLEPAKNGEYTLRYAVRGKQGWSEKRTVIAQRSFFRHPAEVPAVVQLNPKLWMAHWVEQGEEESDAEFIYVSSSTNGIQWTAPQRAHKDSKPVQHGLVSMIQSGTAEISLFWLETPMGEDGPAYLMRSVVSAAGKFIKEERLDSDVCSCCPTAVAKTAKGLLVAYRDHTAGDIRDTSVLRFENGKWSLPKNVHADGWKLSACPINGPALAAKGNRAAISWFTAAKDTPKVQLAFSEDGGVTFGAPLLVSTAKAYGYTGTVMMDDGSVLVSWIEQSGEDARLMVRRVSSSGMLGPAAEVVKGGRAALGYPKLLHSPTGDWIAWGASKLGLASLRP